MLLKLDSGGHIGCKDLEVIDCIAYQIEPLSDVSYNVLDVSEVTSSKGSEG